MKQKPLSKRKVIFYTTIFAVNFVGLIFITFLYLNQNEIEHSNTTQNETPYWDQISNEGKTEKRPETSLIVEDSNESRQAILTLVKRDQSPFDPGTLITSVKQKGKVISLTFDSSWEFKNTQELIDILDGYNIKATFFVTGSWAEKHPDLIQLIVSHGHEIGNHSYSHPDFTQISRVEMINEVTKTDQVLQSQVGYHSNLFRLPYGASNQSVLSTLGELGYFVIGWSTDSLDWKENISAEEILYRIKRYHQDGGIILFHVGGYQTPFVLPDVIEWYLDNGYSFVKVSDLIKEN